MDNIDLLRARNGALILLILSATLAILFTTDCCPIYTAWDIFLLLFAGSIIIIFALYITRLIEIKKSQHIYWLRMMGLKETIDFKGKIRLIFTY